MTFNPSLSESVLAGEDPLVAAIGWVSSPNSFLEGTCSEVYPDKSEVRKAALFRAIFLSGWYRQSRDSTGARRHSRGGRVRLQHFPRLWDGL